MEIVSIIESISVILAAISILVGISAWRREFVGKRNIELVEEVLALFYESRDAINYIRFPFSNTNEGNSRKPGSDETNEEKEIYRISFVPIERYNKYQDKFNRLFSLRYQYMARFGKNTIEPFNELQSIISKILSSANNYAELRIEQNKMIVHKVFQRDSYLEKELNEYKDIIWSRSKDDKLIPQINNIITAIENQASKILTPSFIVKVKQWIF